MNCKNCNIELSNEDNFCNDCGAKVVKNRITIKSLFSHLFLALGWDSNFFITLRHMIYKPQLVLKEYIGGTRKKYANPFTFFAISLAISLFVFNQYSKEFIQMSIQHVKTQDSTTTDNNSKGLEMFGYESQAEFTEAMLKLQMKYYNIVSFSMLPLYALIAFIVFRKPYNYGEHLVINTYLLSVTTFSSILLFLFNLLTGINIFTYAIFVVFFYYSFTYKKLYSLTFAKLILKTLKFLGILLLLLLVLVIIGFVSVVIKNKI